MFPTLTRSLVAPHQIPVQRVVPARLTKTCKISMISNKRQLTHHLALLVITVIILSIPSYGSKITTDDNINSSTALYSRSFAQQLGDSIMPIPILDEPGNIPVNIQLKPVEYFENKVYVSTGTNLTAIAEILDEKFRNLSITYQWSVKNKTIVTDTKASKIVYRFDLPDPDNFLKVLVVHRPNDTGTSQKNLVVRNPISVEDPKDKLFLEHGELLQVNLKYTGTGPFSYCHRIHLEDKYKDQESCKPDIITDSHDVYITKYLRYVGNYTLLFVVDNLASRVEKHYSVKIIETTRNQTVPYVPIVCSIIAVFILLSGLALHLKFKRTIYTETADFDFTRNIYDEEEDWGEEQTFSQRVKYLLFRARQDDRENLMN